MGLFTSYVIYKYGKKKANQERDELEAYLSDVCDRCGHERRYHADDRNQTCPKN